MASSNIKLFDENKGNMLSDSEFSISNQRMNGLQTGVASSQLQNKAMYQASLVAYAIAQVMMQNGKNANDTDAVSAFVANLSGTMLQKVYDIATTAEAQAGVATGKWMSPALVKAAIDYKFANAVTFGNTVTLAGDPTENLQAATKQYVDNVIRKETLYKSTINVSGTYSTDKPMQKDITGLDLDSLNGLLLVTIKPNITATTQYGFSLNLALYNGSAYNNVSTFAKFSSNYVNGVYQPSVLNELFSFIFSKRSYLSSENSKQKTFTTFADVKVSAFTIMKKYKLALTGFQERQSSTVVNGTIDVEISNLIV